MALKRGSEQLQCRPKRNEYPGTPPARQGLTQMLLRDRLHAWKTALQHDLTLREKPTDDEVENALVSGVVWLRWRRSEPTLSHNESLAQRTLEGLELLVFLARSDYEEWLELLQEYWPRAMAVWQRVFHPKRFQLGCELRVQTALELEELSQRLVRYGHSDSASDKYEEMRCLLEPSSSLGAKPMPIRLTLEEPMALSTSQGAPDHPHFVDYAQTLQALFDLVKLQHSLQSTSIAPKKNCWRPLFQISDVDVDVAFPSPQIQNFPFLRQIATHGVRIRHLKLFGLDFRITRSLYIADLQDLLAVATNRACLPCERVSIDWISSPRTLDAIFSALLESTSVKQVCIDSESSAFDATQDEGRWARLWLWVAVAVFSSHASNPIDKFSVRADALEPQDVVFLQHFLTDQDTLAALFQHQRLTRPFREYVASASRFELRRPHHQDADDASHQFTSQVPLTNLTLLDDHDEESEYRSVLLPGWGQAWVRRSDVTIVQAPIDEVVSAIRPIPHLLFHRADENSKHSIQEMLRVVGAGVRTLTIKWVEAVHPLSDSWIWSMFTNCPDLEDLRIYGTAFESLDCFAKCYERGICHATRITIKPDWFEDYDTVHQFFDYLADELHPMAAQLRHLKLLTDKLFHPLPGVLLSTLQMLRRNQSLASLSLELSFDGQEIDEEEALDGVELLDEIAAHDGEPLGGRLAPLRFKSKLAFLSVVWPRQSELLHRAATSGRVIEALDESSVTKVFQFAAETHRRIVCVSVE